MQDIHRDAFDRLQAVLLGYEYSCQGLDVFDASEKYLYFRAPFISGQALDAINQEFDNNFWFTKDHFVVEK